MKHFFKNNAAICILSQINYHSMNSESERESLKSFIVKVYFSQQPIDHVENVKLKLEKKENRIIKSIGLPKFLHTSYHLIASNEYSRFTAKVPLKEKDALKHILNLIYKN